MVKVLVTPRSLKSADHPALRPLRDAGFEMIFPSPGVSPDADTLKAALPGCQGWLAGVEKITADVIQAAPDLKIISRNGVGVDNVDLEAAKARGVLVANTPGANARGVAELALALILAVARGVPLCDASIKAGGWERRQGIELEGATLGVVGTGQIGRILIRMALGIGMKTVGYDLYPDASFDPGDFRYVEPLELARVSDVVSVHIPGGDRPFVDAAFLAAMKKNAIVVNTARASAVDETAVLAALEDGRLLGYGVDAFENEPPGATPLTTNSRVVCTSHIGGFTAESVMRAAERAAKNIVDKLKG